MDSAWEFWLLSFLVAMVQGGSQALSRSLFASMIPKQKSSEFFGFFGVFEKFAGVMGPALFAVTVRYTGSSRNAILSVIAFFVIGAILLWKVDVERGQQMARAAEAAPDDPDILFNLGYAYALDRDPQGAIYWLRETLRRNPTDGDAHVVLANALDAAGSTVEAARERELAGQLSTRHADDRKDLPRGLERVRQDVETAAGPTIDRTILNTAQRDQQDLAQFHLERGRRLFEQEQDREAMLELRRVVFLSPYEAEAHLLIGRIHLRGGRPREAVNALKISIWSRDTAAAHVALAEAYLRLKDLPTARSEVQKALTLDPASAAAKQLQEKIDKGGQ